MLLTKLFCFSFLFFGRQFGHFTGRREKEKSEKNSVKQPKKENAVKRSEVKEKEDEKKRNEKRSSKPQLKLRFSSISKSPSRSMLKCRL